MRTIIYLNISAAIILGLLLLILFTKKPPVPVAVPAPAPVSATGLEPSSACVPKVNEVRPRASNYVRDRDGKCVPTGCMSGFTKNRDGKCVVLRKFNWII